MAVPLPGMGPGDNGLTAAAVELAVEVRDADTGAPVPGARVELTDNTALVPALAAAGAGMHDPAGRRLRAALAQVATTGSEGTAAFQVAGWRRGVLMIEAAAAGRWGFAVSGLVEERRVVIRLGADRELAVQVVDPAGRPRAGIPVAVRCATGPSPEVQYSFQATATEPPDGVARFLHFQRRLLQGPVWQLTFAFPLRDQPVVLVDAATPPAPPQRLVLPPTGGLRVRVRQQDGSVPDLDGLELLLQATAGGRKLWPLGPWARPPLERQRGEALVKWLGLGLELQVELRRQDSVVAARTIAGPVREGEVVECELPLQQPQPALVRGRFVHRDGTPWPLGTVRAQVMLFPAPPGHPGSQELAVDAGGRFALPVRHARPPTGWRRCRITAELQGDLGLVTATLALDQEVPPTGLELGDVLLDRGPLLAGGRVLDPDQRPVPRAYVQVQATEAAEPPHWQDVVVSGRPITGADGTFALHLEPGAPEPGARLRLSAGASGFVAAAPTVCRRGDDQVVVVLQPAGSLAGAFVFAAGQTARDLAVEVRRSDQPAAPAAVTVATNGTFASRDLPAGIYDLQVRRLGPDNRPEGRPALVVDGLVVRPGEVNRDPRLQHLAVDNPWSTIAIRVRERGGAPVADATAMPVGRRTGAPFQADDQGVCHVHCAQLPIDVEVAAFGFRPRLLRGLDRDTEVELEAGIRVVLRAGGLPTPGRSYQLSGFLYDVTADGRRGAMTYGQACPWQRRAFDSQGELAVALPHAGVYECELHVGLIGDDHVGRGGPVLLPSPLRITVLERSEPQVFELSTPADAITAAIARAVADQTGDAVGK